jgi:sodium pump decarboxylase gamma subunit
MEATIPAAINVSILAMCVIFTVLVILIFTIQLLVKLMPYKAPPAPVTKPVAASASGQDDQVAVITATLAAHMGKRPDEFRIVNIQSR